MFVLMNDTKSMPKYHLKWPHSSTFISVKKWETYRKKINSLPKYDTHEHQTMQFYLSVRFILFLIRFYPIRIQYETYPIRNVPWHRRKAIRWANGQKTKEIAQKHDMIVHRCVNRNEASSIMKFWIKYCIDDIRFSLLQTIEVICQFVVFLDRVYN